MFGKKSTAGVNTKEILEILDEKKTKMKLSLKPAPIALFVLKVVFCSWVAIKIQNICLHTSF